MAKKGKSGEQLPLIDVLPEDAKPIIEAAKLYKEYMLERITWSGKEVAQRNLVREMVAKAGFQRLPDGTIRFSHDGVTITITPQDDKISVKEEG